MPSVVDVHACMTTINCHEAQLCPNEGVPLPTAMQECVLQMPASEQERERERETERECDREKKTPREGASERGNQRERERDRDPTETQRHEDVEVQEKDEAVERGELTSETRTNMTRQTMRRTSRGGTR